MKTTTEKTVKVVVMSYDGKEQATTDYFLSSIQAIDANGVKVGGDWFPYAIGQSPVNPQDCLLLQMGLGSFPSLLQSAEDQRRLELNGGGK